MRTEDAYTDAMLSFFPQSLPEKIIVAVSGGGDSIALLRAAARRAVSLGHEVEACTVDHLLRKGSTEEADWVSDICSSLGVRHETLRWDAGPGSGANIQEEARLARIRLIGEFAMRRNAGAVLLGHNEDDIAENYLMRGTGMSPLRIRDGVIWARPLLSCPRRMIRDELDGDGVPYVNDPSNENAAYRRVQARTLLASDPDLRREALGKASEAMRIRRAGKEGAFRILAESVEVSPEGFADLDISGVDPGPGLKESVRVLICAFGDADPRFRPGRLEGACEKMRGKTRFTLGGCMITPDGKGRVRFSREAARVSPITAIRGQDVRIEDRVLIEDAPGDGTIHMRASQDGVSRPVLVGKDGKTARLPGVLLFGKEDLTGERFFNEPDCVVLSQAPSPDFQT